MPMSENYWVRNRAADAMLWMAMRAWTVLLWGVTGALWVLWTLAPHAGRLSVLIADLISEVDQTDAAGPGRRGADGGAVVDGTVISVREETVNSNG